MIMPFKNIEFGGGVLYAQAADGETFLLGDAKDVSLTEEYHAFDPDGHMVKRIDSEASIEMRMRVRGLRSFLMSMMGVTPIALKLIKESGYGRVVHLALYGKKKRTRKKNIRRACRTLEKEDTTNG